GGSRGARTPSSAAVTSANLADANPVRQCVRGVDNSVVRRYLTWVRTTISSKGQIVLPAVFRQMDRIEPGQEFDIERIDRGKYRIVRRAAAPNEGAVDWLLA